MNQEEHEDRTLAARVAELEARVARLELGTNRGVSQGESVSGGLSDSSPISVEVSNKRFEPADSRAGRYTPYVWFDCTFLPTGLSKVTRSVKGQLEFCDLFDEPKFLIGYTLNEPLHPGQRHLARGVGFEFNEFLPDHQWVQATSVKDLRVKFRVSGIIYQDGTSDVPLA